jgi:hypothetical protein
VQLAFSPLKFDYIIIEKAWSNKNVCVIIFGMRKHYFFVLIGIFAALFIAQTGNAAKSAAPPDNFSINTPPQNFKTLDERVKIAGSIKKFKETGLLKINGREISTDKKGAFDAGLVLHPGKNSVYIGFTNKEGLTKRLLWKILRVVKFPDMDDAFDGEQHWAKKQITDLATLGIIEPYPDGFFLPNNDITKGEFTTWLSRALSLPMEPADRDVFYDVSREHWRAPFIQSVVKKGYMTSADGTYFGLDNNISRIDAVSIALKADGVTNLTYPNIAYFDDIPIDDPRNKIVSAAAAEGLTIGISRTSHWFDPERNITRAEAVSLLSGLHKVRQKIENIDNWGSGFSDAASMCSVNALPEIIRTFASPESVIADGKSSVRISAQVNDPDGLEDVLMVKVDLTQFGGPPDAVMYDDGTHGDISPKDGFFTLSLVINSDTAPGQRSATITAFDRSGVATSKELSVNVFPLKIKK